MRELLLALRLEVFYSKKQILTMYFQRAPYGGNLVGVETASWFYFQRAPTHMGWAEAALLAVLPQKPSMIRLQRNRIKLKNKRDRLLEKLYRIGKIDKMQLSIAQSSKMPKAAKRPEAIAKHLLTHSRQFNKSPVGESSLNYWLQKKTKVLLDDYVKNKSGSKITNGALVVIDNQTGKPIAFHGNAEYLGQDPIDSSPYVNIALSARSTGSTLKPFLFAGMLDQGLLTPEMLVFDTPLWFKGFHLNLAPTAPISLSRPGLGVQCLANANSN